MERITKRLNLRLLVLIILLTLSFLAITAAQTGVTNIVLYASEASVRVGNWQVVSDSTAAGGARIHNSDQGAAKRSTALANPADYFEMTFNAQANTAYRLWIRSNAQNDYWGNDSIFIQFSGSVTSGQSPVYRIGTTSAMEMNLEDCSGCGVQGWGWQDNGWGVGVLGPQVYFQTTGTQTLRVQVREDGLSIDQIVLSPTTYLNNSPGALKNDTTILPKSSPPPPPPPPPSNQPPQVTISATPTSGTAPLLVNFSSSASDPDGFIASYNWTFGDGNTSSQSQPQNIYQSAGTFTARLTVSDNLGATASATRTITVGSSPPPPPPPTSNPTNIVIWASDIPISQTAGNWTRVFDSTAAGQTALRNPDNGGAKLGTALANPTNYFEMSFNAVAGVPYHLWIRSKAQNDYWGNDSVFVQFSGSVDAAGSAINRIGTTSGMSVNLEDCSGCGIQGWGWQDDGWGVGVMGPQVYFQTTGQQTLRVQVREDGISIDQIALSPTNYLNNSPGALKNDTTILPSTIGSPPPPPPPPPSNQPPQVTISATPTSGTAPLLVNFSSSASDPDGFIASYSWTFGDGNTSSQSQPQNIYQGAGTFTARLTVSDNLGLTATVTTIITVNSPAPPPSGGQLKVMTWNVAFGKGTDNVFNPDRTATYIANFNPDIVAMCEVPLALAPTLRDLVSQKTGRAWYYHHVVKYVGTDEGNMILSKHPISSTSHRYFSYQRSVAQATVTVSGRTINFFATHLDPDSSTRRAAQVNELKGFASGFAESRIIAGDFNAGPDTPEMVLMQSGYYDSWMQAMNAAAATAYPDNPVGMHTRTRRGRIDAIWYSSGTGYIVLRGGQIPDTRDLSNPNVVITLGTLDDRGVRPSDHNPALSVFEVR